MVREQDLRKIMIFDKKESTEISHGQLKKSKKMLAQLQKFILWFFWVTYPLSSTIKILYSQNGSKKDFLNLWFSLRKGLASELVDFWNIIILIILSIWKGSNR